MSDQTPLFDQGEVNGIPIGSPVRWTKVSTYSKTFSMTVRDGTLVGADGDMGVVKLKSGKKINVPLALLHTPEVPTLLDKYMNPRHRA